MVSNILSSTSSTGLDALSDIDQILAEIRIFSSQDPKPKVRHEAKGYPHDYKEIANREVQLRIQAMDTLSAIERKHKAEVATLRIDLQEMRENLKKSRETEMEKEDCNQNLKRRIEALESELQDYKRKSKAEKILTKRAVFYAVNCARLLKSVNMKLIRVKNRCKIATDEIEQHKMKSRAEIDELHRREHRQSNYIMLLEARLRAVNYGESWCGSFTK